VANLAQRKFYLDSQTVWDRHSEHGGFGFGAGFSDLPDGTASHTFHAFGRTWEYSGARSPMGGGVRTLADREDPARVTDWSFRKSGQGESIIELTVMNLFIGP
jgi:hypothetical protein